MLEVQAFLGMFFVTYSSFIHNKSFITSCVTVCEISSNIISFVFATNHSVKMWPHATIMEGRKKEELSFVFATNHLKPWPHAAIMEHQKKEELNPQFWMTIIWKNLQEWQWI